VVVFPFAVCVLSHTSSLPITNSSVRAEVWACCALHRHVVYLELICVRANDTVPPAPRGFVEFSEADEAFFSAANKAEAQLQMSLEMVQYQRGMIDRYRAMATEKKAIEDNLEAQKIKFLQVENEKREAVRVPQWGLNPRNEMPKCMDHRWQIQMVSLFVICCVN
jgi:hypothetical protein